MQPILLAMALLAGQTGGRINQGGSGTGGSADRGPATRGAATASPVDGTWTVVSMQTGGGQASGMKTDSTVTIHNNVLTIGGMQGKRQSLRLHFGPRSMLSATPATGDDRGTGGSRGSPGTGGTDGAQGPASTPQTGGPIGGSSGAQAPTGGRGTGTDGAATGRGTGGTVAMGTSMGFYALTPEYLVISLDDPLSRIGGGGSDRGATGGERGTGATGDRGTTERGTGATGSGSDRGTTGAQGTGRTGTGGTGTADNRRGDALGIGGTDQAHLSTGLVLILRKSDASRGTDRR